MEKLTPKHNHTLTDILKVGIFGIILLLPFLLFLPSIAYFGFNKEANVPTKQVEVQENKVIDFNQHFNTTNNVTGLSYVLNHSFSNATNQNVSLISGISNLIIGNTYYVRFTDLDANINNNNYYIVTFGTSNYITKNVLDNNTGFTFEASTTNLSMSQVFITNGNIQTYSCYCGIFDLTQMGLEDVTTQQFNTYFPNSYYPYTESQKMLVERTIGTETLADITTQVELNWQQIWNRPLFSWTKYTILIQGLDKFTYIFGIVDTCYITNLLTYELVMIAIYIVFDIILKMFTWLTHMIGNK